MLTQCVFLLVSFVHLTECRPPLLRASYNRVRLIHRPFASMLTPNLLATHGISLHLGLWLACTIPCSNRSFYRAERGPGTSFPALPSSSSILLTSMLVTDNDITPFAPLCVSFSARCCAPNPHSHTSSHRDYIYHRVLITFLLAQKRR